MTAIEDARDASDAELIAMAREVFDPHETPTGEMLLGWISVLADALERATTPPTDDEREALRPIISEARRIQRPDYPNASTDDEVIDAVLAAGFRRQGPITDEWEFEADAD